MLEKASQLHMERCARWSLDGPLNVAVTGLTCLQSRGRQFPVPSYQTRLAESASRVASRFVDLALIAQGQNHAGAATVMWSTAQCLAPGENLAPRVERTRQELPRPERHPLSPSRARRLDVAPGRFRALGRVRVPGLGTAALGAVRESRIAARRARAAPAPGGRGHPDAREDPHRAQENRALCQRQGGGRGIPTTTPPRRTSRSPRASCGVPGRRRRRRTPSARKAQEKHEATCVTCPTPKSPCEEAREAATDESDARNARDLASKTLNNTPATVLVDVYDDFT